MLNLTAGQTGFLTQFPRRRAVVRLEIIDRLQQKVVKVIQSTPGDAKRRNQLAIIGGNVRVDTASDVLRTLSMDIADPQHELNLDVNGLIGLDKLYRVYKGYAIPSQYGGGVALWAQGVFVLTGQPQIDGAGGGRVIRIQGGDKTCLGNGRPEGKFPQPYTVAQGSKKTAAIRTLAQLWGETEFNLSPESTATVPFDYPFEDQSAPWDAITRINDIPEPDGRITRRLFDPYGALTVVMDPGPDLGRLPPVWSAKPVTSGFSQLVRASMVADLHQLGNASRVKWGSRLVTPGVVTVKDSDPNSPTYTGKIGFRVVDWLGGQPDELIRNQAEGLARANYEYQRMKAYQERVSMALVEAPFLEPWDVIEAEEPVVDVAGNYQLLAFTVDLGNSGVTQAEGRRLRTLG